MRNRTMCYVSITMSTQSPSPNIIIIITPILRRYSCLSSLIIPLRLLGHFPESISELLRGHDYSESISNSELTIILQVHHWHILCQRYSVIVGGYHLGLFTQHLDLRLVFQGMGMHGMIFYFYHMFIPCLRIYV